MSSSIDRTKFEQASNFRVADPLPPRLGLSTARTEYGQNLFKVLLGMEYVLYVKTQSAHWNITGMSFAELHKLFQGQYEALAGFVDRIAEQIRGYGYAAPGSMQEFLALNNVAGGDEEVQGILFIPKSILTALMQHHETLIIFLSDVRTDDLDLGAQNLIGDLVTFHTKSSWMIRAHLE